MVEKVEQRHVDYKNPPVVEVVCGAIFHPVENFSATTYGRFWDTIHSEFPSAVDQPPLEQLPTPGSIQFSFEAVKYPRTWFISEDEKKLLQVQRDRFHFNWRRLDDTDAYPTFESVYSAFEKNFNLFRKLVGDIKQTQYELTYINHIPVDSNWSGFGDIGAVLPDVSWRNNEDRFLPAPTHIRWEAQFVLPENAGVLIVNAGSARSTSTGKSVLTLNLTARGPAGILATEDWFALARKWIVKGFTDITGDAMHRNAWKKREVSE